MYETIWRDYKKAFYTKSPRLPKKKAFSVGRALWAIKNEKKIKHLSIARQLEMTESHVHRICGDHNLTSSPSRIGRYAEAVGVNIHEFLQAAREEFFGNFFITKAIMPPDEDVQKYARAGLFLHPQVPLEYPGLKVTVHTPPIESCVDFFSATFQIEPKHQCTGWQLPQSASIQIFVRSGALNIYLQNHKNPIPLKAGQLMNFDGGFPHDIENLSEGRQTEFMISFHPTSIMSAPKELSTFTQKPALSLDNIPEIIEGIQKRQSRRPGKKISLRELADCTGIKAKELNKLVKKQYEDFPIDKLESIAQFAGVSFEDLFSPDTYQNNSEDFDIVTSQDRGVHNYSHTSGIVFYPFKKLDAKRRDLLMGQAILESAPSPKLEKNWESTKRGYLLLKGSDGRAIVHVGKRHHYPDLERDDTIYFDMNLGFSVGHFSTGEQTVLFFTTTSDLF